MVELKMIVNMDEDLDMNRHHFRDVRTANGHCSMQPGEPFEMKVMIQTKFIQVLEDAADIGLYIFCFYHIYHERFGFHLGILPAEVCANSQTGEAVT